MKSKGNHNIRFFLMGVLTTLLVLGLAVPALAVATKTIDVSTGVSIYIDDVKLNPTDAAGNPVEPFIYNGTTYLPVRAVSEAVGKPVQWDGSTYSVYLGKHSSDTPAAYLSEMDYFSGDESITTMISDLDNAGNTHNYCMTKTFGFERTYKINGQYSRITGVLYQRHEQRSLKVPNDRGVAIYGDGRLLYSNLTTEFIDGLEPTSFDIDLTGVLELRVVLRPTNGNYAVLALGDVALWT